MVKFTANFTSLFAFPDALSFVGSKLSLRDSA